MDIADYTSCDATELAALIDTGQVSAAEVHRAAAAALDQVDPQLGAIAGERFEHPLDYNESGPFRGVPFAIKDLITHAAGIPQRNGSRLFGPGIAYPYDNHLMTRFRRAGLATMAVTTSPELGFNATTEAVAYGRPTRNPWDPERSPGGSSGGSAALVAAGALPFAHANDGGGSIRIPAAACGLVGLKPSIGRITAGPDHADPLLGLGVEFAVTRTVRDCAALFDAVHGSEPGDKYLFPAPSSPYAELITQESRPLRIAFSTTALDPSRRIDPECVHAVRSVADQLAAMGHHVEESTPTIDPAAFDRANLDAWCSFLSDVVTTFADQAGIAAGLEHLEATTLACAAHGATRTAADIYAVERVFNTARREVARFLTGYDVYLTPTTARPNLPLGYLDSNDPTLDAHGWYSKIFDYAPFTALFNATGHPAVSLPLAESERGWPIGVQFVGRYGDEATLLQLAGNLEAAMPWADRRPPIYAA